MNATMIADVILCFRTENDVMLNQPISHDVTLYWSHSYDITVANASLFEPMDPEILTTLDPFMVRSLGVMADNQTS